MNIELGLDAEWRVTPTIKKAIAKLERQVSNDPDEEPTIPMIVDNTQLRTLRVVLELLETRNRSMCTHLGKLIEPYPVEVKDKFVKQTMPLGVI